MELFPFPFLANIAEKNPAFARACEVALYSAAVYLLTSLQQGTLVNAQAVIMTCVTPLLAYFSKLVRDTGAELNS